MASNSFGSQAIILKKKQLLRLQLLVSYYSQLPSLQIPASPLAMASPIPLLAPETIATLPSKLKSGLIQLVFVDVSI